MGTAELQSIVTMEAMATHLPIIGANAIALPDLIHNKENGVLVEPGDIEGVANAINFVFEDEIKRKKMGEISFEYIKQHDIKNIIKQYENFYKQAMRKV